MATAAAAAAAEREGYDGRPLPPTFLERGGGGGPGGDGGGEGGGRGGGEPTIRLPSSRSAIGL